ncbi:MAG: hypothetical protein JXL80_17820 [Planctomycetes bacterium]|nr:hypothetical protein [Planctomycetota bacterium]
MRTTKIAAVLSALLALVLGGVAQAATVAVSSDISGSVTWTSNNTYQLKKQIYVLPGATLTIQAGTVVKSLVADQGSLAVCRGAKIYVKGTKDAPVIMTSSNDTMTSWHEGCNEWGNLTIMGDAYISASHYGGSPVIVLGRANSKTFDALNQKQMEGLTASGSSDTKVLYGGGNDDDDSGSISYLSLRYGGKVIGLANELNGLSLGGIGRETDIHHVEVINNVDDGVEIWGGTVNLKYVSIWNVGDDSFDVDEGWRGKAQFLLIVQGYSTDAAQGSGVGDNCFEADGAEDSDAVPVTTTAIYNATVIGQPVDGDHGTAWRDNARVQYRNCVFMNLGEALVKNDNSDGDGANGYGYNGTLSWASTWTTASSANPPHYQAQVDGYLAEITDSVFYQNLYASAYTESTSRGVHQAGKNNVTASTQPIQYINRAAPVTRGGKTMIRVTSLNPCAANDAVTSVKTAPADGFFTPAPFRGAFSATNNWLEGWTATDAYGMTVTTMNTEDPPAAPAVTYSIFFPTVSGTVYTIEESTDLQNWTPIGCLVGTGGTMSVTDLTPVEAGKFYRVINQ